jgi:hypothetical protein
VFTYLDEGLAPVPIPFGEKAPVLKEWQKLRLKKENARDYFVPTMNVGILLGEASKGLIDIDLDCADALFLAPEFLPKTEAIFGRASKSRSHWLYRVSGSIDTLRLKASGGEVLLELRGNGCQTVFPPSYHSGERVEWLINARPGEVDPEELRKCALLLAISCLILAQWPERGGRHDFALSVAGGLLSDGLDSECVERIISGVCIAVGDDELRDRLKTISSTARKLGMAQPTAGWSTIRNSLGDGLVGQIRKISGRSNESGNSQDSRSLVAWQKE